MLATLVEPPWLRTFADATPTGWAMEGLNEIILRESGLAAVTSTIGIPMAYGAACLAACVRFYRMSD
jgi:ABC-type multidrug transport system permease subunit